MKKSMLRVIAVLIGITGITAFMVLGYQHTSRGFPREVPAACNPYGPFAYPLDSLSVIDTSQIGYLQTDSVLLQLEQPHRFCIDEQDWYYIAAEGGVYRIDSGSAAVRVLVSEEKIHAVTVSQAGVLYAATQQHLLRLAPDGTPAAALKVGLDSTYITSIAADGGSIYLADAGKRLVWWYDSAGREIGRIGQKDSSRGIPGFVVPSPYMDCLLGQDGSLWVVNPGRHLVENYRRNGDLITSWGSTGTELESFCGCCNPVHLALTPDGSFVTVEKGIVRVKVYGPAGTFTTAVAPQTAFSENCTGLVPAVDSQGRIHILDLKVNMIRIFTRKKGAAAHAA